MKFLKFSLLPLLLSSAAWAQTPEPVALDLREPTTVQSPRLGLAFPGADTANYQKLKDAGISVARISASWKYIEPANDQFKFEKLDSQIKALHGLGITPFITFESTAIWGTQDERDLVKNARPLDLNDWRDFVSTVVERYDADGVDDMEGLSQPVHFYQVANEFVGDDNKSGGWAGTPDELKEFINTSYRAVKVADENSLLVMGGLASMVVDIMLVTYERESWPLEQSWSETSKSEMSIKDARSWKVKNIAREKIRNVFRDAKFDLVDVHLYGPENRDPARIKALAELGGEPVISSECGGPSLDYGGKYTPAAHFKSAISRNLNVLANGAEICMWFGLGEAITSTYGNQYVALYDKNEQEKPGVYAYRLLSRLLPDFKAKVTAKSYSWKIAYGKNDYVELGFGPRSVETPSFWIKDLTSGIIEPVTSASRYGADSLLIGGPAAARILGVEISEKE